MLLLCHERVLIGISQKLVFPERTSGHIRSKFEKAMAIKRLLVSDPKKFELYDSSSDVRRIKLRRLRCAGHV